MNTFDLEPPDAKLRQFLFQLARQNGGELTIEFDISQLTGGTVDIQQDGNIRRIEIKADA